MRIMQQYIRMYWRRLNLNYLMMVKMMRSCRFDHANLSGRHLLGISGSVARPRGYWHTMADLSRSRLLVMASV